MADLDKLLADYIAAHKAGEKADASNWLERVEGGERAQLAAMIDHYLAQVPMRSWDPEGFRDSGLAEFAEQTNRALYGAAGSWAVVLPQLRKSAQIRRADLVSRLAAALGVKDREKKVGAYYHQMERGTLPPEGVDDRVLEAL